MTKRPRHQEDTKSSAKGHQYPSSEHREIRYRALHGFNGLHIDPCRQRGSAKCRCKRLRLCVRRGGVVYTEAYRGAAAGNLALNGRRHQDFAVQNKRKLAPNDVRGELRKETPTLGTELNQNLRVIRGGIPIDVRAGNVIATEFSVAINIKAAPLVLLESFVLDAQLFDG